MNWMKKLMPKPAAMPATPATKIPVDDSERLRRALDAAAGDEERRQAAHALGHELARLLQPPRGEDPPEVWVAALCQIADKLLALAWLDRLAGDAWLGEVAIHGRLSDIRLAASQRVEESTVLEHVAQASRDKDKRVYRGCAERLRQRHQAEDDARRAVKLAADLRALLDVAPLHLSHLLDLEKDYRTLGEEASSLAGCKDLLDQAHLRLQADSALQRDLSAQAISAGLLLQECASEAWPEAAQLADWRARLATLAQAQPGLPPWLCGQAAAKNLAESLRDIASRLALQDGEAECVAAAELFLADAAAQGPAGMLDAAAWAALEKPGNPLIRQSLESRWLALLPPAQPAAPPTAPPAKPAARPAKLDQDALRRLLGKLEGDIEQGRLADAEAAEQALDAVLAGASLHGELASRLQQARGQLGTLRGWARWGTQQVREELIAAAEQLLTAAPSVDELAQGIPLLREKWKQLNAHGASAKDQWQRFDSALSKAYQPVAARHAEEAVRQAAAREVKAALCGEWESYFSAIDWEHIDHKALEVQRQDILRRWRGADQASFRDERMLRKRLDKVLAGIAQKLDALHGAELERRMQLIGEAEALGELPDLGRAITQAKALQERWTRQMMPVRLKRGEEEKLWRRFRAACAAVFARRDAQRTQQVAQRKEQTQALRDILDPFAASLANSETGEIKKALSQFRSDWKAAATNFREAAAALEVRAQALQQQAQQRIEMLRQEKHSTQFDLLVKKAALAADVESAVLAPMPAEAVIAAAKQAWEALPRLPGKAEGLLAERLARAPGVTALTLTGGREARATLLLDMELALGLPSPDACADARRRRQLEHLQSRFGADSRPPPEVAVLLVDWYAIAAAPDAALDQRIAAVRGKLIEQSGLQAPR